MQKNLSVLTCGWHVSEWNFNFLIDFFHFSIPLTCQLHVSNKKLQPRNPIFFDPWRVVDTSVANTLCFSLLPDVCLTRQWYAFFLTDMWVTRHWNEFLVLTCQPHVSACQMRKKRSLTCDSHVNDTLFFSLTCGSHVTEANFCYWRVNHTSVHADFSKILFFRTTDVWMTRQGNHRVTVLAPVWLNSQKSKKFCLEAKAKRFLNCKQYFS